MLYLIGFIAAIIIQRLLELRVAKRNLEFALSNGGKEYSPEHYKFIVLLHVSWIVFMLLEGILRGSSLSNFWWLWLGIFTLAQFGRYWAITSLGKYWNTRIIIFSGGNLVAKGPYKYFKHPNYIVVALELFVAPMIFGCWVTAVLSSLVNAALLLGVRIPAEERALEEYKKSIRTA
jgi:methyltransferase